MTTRTRVVYKSGREFVTLSSYALPSLAAKTRRSNSQIKVDSIFTSYRIQSNASNEITMSLSSEALLGALKSASSSASASSSYETEEVVMKLAKKNDQAVLSFEISGLTRVGRKVRVSHDVKIEVMKPGDVARLREPMCPQPDVRPFRRCRVFRRAELIIRAVTHHSSHTSKAQNHRRPTPAHVRHPRHPRE